MRVVLVGLSHRTAPVAFRERLSFYGRDVGDLLHSLRDAAGLPECAAVSTCNRTEIYASTQDEDWQERLLDWMAHIAGVTPGQLQDHIYSYEGAPAVRHLMRVAAGLDSMVMGEGQVLAQVREAQQWAVDAGTAGTALQGLFRYALAAGKRARTETEIGRGAVSVSFVAVQLARQIFQRLDGRVVLLVGAGEMGEQTARMLLADRAAPRLLVANRTQTRAEELAETFGGAVIPFDRLADGLAQADIVITSTGAAAPIISTAMVRLGQRGRRGRPLFVIDIAVPRDVEASVGELDDVYLYNIDDLQAVIAKSLAGREAEAERVEAIVEEEKDRYLAWQRGLKVGPTIKQLQHLADEIIMGETQRLGGKLSHLSERDRDVVDAMVRGVVNKLMRRPILHLREAANSGNGHHQVEHIRAIFDLAEEGAIDLAVPAEQVAGEEEAVG